MSIWMISVNLEKSVCHLRRNSIAALVDENITDEDYQHANKVWEAFNCKKLR